MSQMELAQAVVQRDHASVTAEADVAVLERSLNVAQQHANAVSVGRVATELGQVREPCPDLRALIRLATLRAVDLDAATGDLRAGQGDLGQHFGDGEGRDLRCGCRRWGGGVCGVVRFRHKVTTFPKSSDPPSRAKLLFTLGTSLS
ncbi:MAG: hypothetical protein J0M12_03315 [Deltaproteobacteria bacterium]|nr:hypothetical protein [Deltaproteobacteria bacterium]